MPERLFGPSRAVSELVCGAMPEIARTRFWASPGCLRGGLWSHARNCQKLPDRTSTPRRTEPEPRKSVICRFGVTVLGPSVFKGLRKNTKKTNPHDHLCEQRKKMPEIARTVLWTISKNSHCGTSGKLFELWVGCS